MYSRPGCHLCDAAADVVRSVQRRCPFEFRIVDIDGDADLERRYGASIPVIAVDGRSVFTYRVEPAELEREVRRLWST